MDTSRYARPVLSIAAMTAAAILLLACVSWHPGDQPGSQVLPAVDPPANWLGRLGAGLAHPFQYWLGPGCYVLLVGLGVGGLLAFHRVEVRDRWLRIAGVLVLTAVVSAAAAKLGRHEGGLPVGRGGVLGAAINASVLVGFGGFFSAVALLSGLAIGVIVVADAWLVRLPGAATELARSFRAGGASDVLAGLSSWVRSAPPATATAAAADSDSGTSVATADTDPPRRAESRPVVRDAEDFASDSDMFEALDSSDDTIAADPLPKPNSDTGSDIDGESRVDRLGLSELPPVAETDVAEGAAAAEATAAAEAKAAPTRESEDYAEAEPVDESDDELLGPTDHLGAGRPSPRAAAWNQYEHTGSTSGVFDAQAGKTLEQPLFDPATTPSQPTTTIPTETFEPVSLTGEPRKLGLRELPGEHIAEPSRETQPNLIKAEIAPCESVPAEGPTNETKPTSTGTTGLLPTLPWKKSGAESVEKPAVSFAAAMGEFDDLAAAINRLADPLAAKLPSSDTSALFDNEELLGALGSGELPPSQRADFAGPDGGESATSTHDADQSHGDRPVAASGSSPKSAASEPHPTTSTTDASPGLLDTARGKLVVSGNSAATPASSTPASSASSGLYGPAAGGLFDDDTFWTPSPATAGTAISSDWTALSGLAAAMMEPSTASQVGSAAARADAGTAPVGDPGTATHQPSEPTPAAAAPTALKLVDSFDRDDPTDPSDPPPTRTHEPPSDRPAASAVSGTGTPVAHAPASASHAPGSASHSPKAWRFPERGLLEPVVRRDPRDAERAVADMAAALDRVLPEFGVDARVVGTDSGPVVTLFELELAPGVKISKLSALEPDLARALKAPSARVVSPLPGRSTVGLEVPNSDKDTVRLVELLENAGDQIATLTLPLLLGKDATGRPLRLDLADLPHLLVAGATGSGKSVAINSMLLSLLMTRRPEEVRLILVDPKIVEMAPYQGIPHLLCPVVSDTAQAKATLEWAVRRMEERYELLAEAGVRHIAAYNQLSRAVKLERMAPLDEREAANIPDRLPYLVLVIDELADLMISSGKDVESHITRLAQKSRAVGIHLILATQRPSVDVVTGLIKANMPARIAFRVASRIDSRTILDQKGADLLLGRGDMLLLLPGENRLLRAQGAFVSDREVSAVTDKLREQGRPEYVAELLSQSRAGDEGTSTADGSSGRDELFDQAVGCVVSSGRGSVSLLQRKLGIGYGRASRLIDQMAEAGIVGEYRGANAREVLMTPEDWATLRSLRDAKP